MEYILSKCTEIKNKILPVASGLWDLEISKKDCLHYTCILPWNEYFLRKKLKPKYNNPGYDEKLFSANAEINSKFSIWQGDITTIEVDAIVNAANTSLLGGSGVDGCIHNAAGPMLRHECEKLKGCSEGHAKITFGYNLPSKYVIHTVGPIGEKPQILKNCYNNSLRILLEKKLRTIAFPSISTGIYGYPIVEATHVAMLQIRHFLQTNKSKVDRIILVAFSDRDMQIFEELAQKYFPVNANNNY